VRGCAGAPVRNGLGRQELPEAVAHPAPACRHGTGFAASAFAPSAGKSVNRA
jgi:hypothetical protein